MNYYDLQMNAGRLLNDLSLDDICKEYKRKVFDLISLLQNRIAVFDFDGTLTEFKYSNGRLLPCKDDDLYEYSKEHSIYNNARLLKTMQYVVNECETDNVYILTVTVETLRESKEKIISYGFPSILKEHIIQVDNSTQKLEVLQDIHSKRNKDIIFVEDTVKTLLTAEENLPYVRGYHISSLII